MHPSRPTLRPALLLAALLSAAASAVDAQQTGVPAFDPGRLMVDVERYHGFGVHRTAHEGDLRTSEWLESRLRGAGLETAEHRFTLRQFQRR